MYRDASWLNRPDVHTVKALHVAVFTDRLNIGSGSVGLGAACETSNIMLNDDLFFEAHKASQNARCRRRACQALFAAADRQHSDLEHIRSYYGLEHRIGVRVELGLHVRHAGRPGVIVDTDGQYLVLRVDGEARPVTAHATSSMEYQAHDGRWTPAIPRPTPEQP
ncbi:KOW domain-containing RNA-binding protein [Streptomyces pseudovenezuelae]|uniref:hypothetical protein n=1 Tax=Streptomyces pseudovenezuelae TaxID=67350 RepID=UPI002E81AE32|nr:hypothetical protein [Streptomyces pseudovenezuelae]WUA94415.1 hypothetical protein OHO81_45060 [Streptomyces pseudovenezuelae]